MNVCGYDVNVLFETFVMAPPTIECFKGDNNPNDKYVFIRKSSSNREFWYSNPKIKFLTSLS